MANVHLMYRIDIGFDPDRGYAAVVLDPSNKRQKGIKANSIEQLTSRLRNVLNEDANKKKRFPLEHERGAQTSIITPEMGDPLFGAT